MDNAPKCFDWVSARKNCNAREMFKRLLKVCEADCNIATGQRPQRNLEFTQVSEEEFSVVNRHDSGVGTVKGGFFRLDGSAIKVADAIPPNRKLFTCHASLLDGGDCTFVIEDNNTPLHPWQISRLALEDVFFRD